VRLVCLLCAPFLARRAAGFDAFEHKYIGDTGSGLVVTGGAFTLSSPGSQLIAVGTDEALRTLGPPVAPMLTIPTAGAKSAVGGRPSGDVSVTVAPGVVATAKHPLLVWVGNAAHDAGSPGGFFTMGDLIATYGDLHRTVTCDPRDLRCTFFVKDSPEVRQRGGRGVVFGLDSWLASSCEPLSCSARTRRSSRRCGASSLASRTRSSSPATGVVCYGVRH
jgi:hypothetical protein